MTIKKLLRELVLRKSDRETNGHLDAQRDRQMNSLIH